MVKIVACADSDIEMLVANIVAEEGQEKSFRKTAQANVLTMPSTHQS